MNKNIVSLALKGIALAMGVAVTRDLMARGGDAFHHRGLASRHVAEHEEGGARAGGRRPARGRGAPPTDDDPRPRSREGGRRWRIASG